MKRKHDVINHPEHYTAHPSGIECITITEHMSFNVGNAMKYLWRAGLKSPDAIVDLRKAFWYVSREINRLEEQVDRACPCGSKRDRNVCHPRPT